jgi:hypothetical protein
MDHITAIETIAEQLKNMGEPQTRLQICTKIIYTLPPHLHGFIAVWEALPEEEKTIALLTAKILNEESKNAIFKPQSKIIKQENTTLCLTHECVSLIQNMNMGIVLPLTEDTVEDMVVAEEVSLVQANIMMAHLLPRSPDTTGHCESTVIRKSLSPHTHSPNAENTHNP